MKINLSKDNARFIVNEEKGKVVCIIDDTENLFIQYVDNNFRIPPDCDEVWNSGDSKLLPKLKMPRRFVGIATCNPNDQFSVESGKLIAFSRTKDKVQTSFFKRANTYVNTLDNWLQQAVESLNRYGSKLERNTERRHNKIAELIGEPEEE